MNVHQHFLEVLSSIEQSGVQMTTLQAIKHNLKLYEEELKNIKYNVSDPRNPKDHNFLQHDEEEKLSPRLHTLFPKEYNFLNYKIPRSIFIAISNDASGHEFFINVVWNEMLTEDEKVAHVFQGEEVKSWDTICCGLLKDLTLGKFIQKLKSESFCEIGDLDRSSHAIIFMLRLRPEHRACKAAKKLIYVISYTRSRHFDLLRESALCFDKSKLGAF